MQPSISILIIDCLFYTTCVYYIACLDVDNCLRNGKEVLLSYGYDINRFNTDIIILGVFYVVSYMLGYYGLLRRTKKQPAY